MLISRPSYQEILDNLMTSVQYETGIDATPDASVMGAILRVFSAELDRLYSRQEELEKSSYLTTAIGSDLDRIGALYGVSRKAITVASTLGLSRSIQFTNNSGGPVNVAIATRLWPEMLPDKAFITTEAGVIQAGGTLLLHAKATGEGGYFNISSREINRHDLPYNGLAVTNILPIGNGQGYETDDSYRYRIQQELTRREGLNQENLTSLLRSLPGISEVLVTPLKRGPGTLDIIIVPSQRGDEFTLLENVESFLTEIVPVGISTKVSLPVFRWLDIEVKLSFNSILTESIDTIRSDVRTALVSYVEAISMETGYGIGSFSGSEALVRVITSNANILNAVLLVALDGRPFAAGSHIGLEIGERFALRNFSIV